MKRLLLLPLLAFSLLALPTPPPSGSVLLHWNPNNKPSTNFIYKLYWSTNLSIPLTNWLVLTNVSGMLTQVVVKVVPGPNFFALTASNFWGETSFSKVAQTPDLLLNDDDVQIDRLP